VSPRLSPADVGGLPPGGRYPAPWLILRSDASHGQDSRATLVSGAHGSAPPEQARTGNPPQRPRELANARTASGHEHQGDGGKPLSRTRTPKYEGLTPGFESYESGGKLNFEMHSRDAILGRAPRQVTQVPHGSQQEREAGRGDQGSEYP
jgi:hypothetical protein